MKRVICPTIAPYDKVSHKIDNNILTTKLPKDKHRIQIEAREIDEPIIHVNCLDNDTCCSSNLLQNTFQGKKCKNCLKINVIHDQEFTPKKPEEEMLLLRTTRQITPTNDMKHSLEVEFKSPRNYIPLPEPGPRVGRIWRTGGRMPAPGAAVEDAPDIGVPVPPGLAAAGAAGPTSREALSPSPRLCVPATTRYTVPAALAAPSAAC
ncbi:hypothetical protein ALC53_12650 [Atta colombica]|uniref:Uncharacterized protein n=1 Tax=Atta colombica TaxID=520822 RepID=A0A151HYT1_9HYME|nr:hypothetical protein ALC53_12650 [Atta colombica]